MVSTTSARPAKTPVRARVVGGARKVAVAKKPAKKAAKKTVKKAVKKAAKKIAAATKTVAKKPAATTRVAKTRVRDVAAEPVTPKRVAKPKTPSMRAIRMRLGVKHQAAAAAAARQTKNATLKRLGDTVPVIADDDIVAQEKLAKLRPALRRTAVDRASDPPPASGVALIERVTRAVERELTQIEIIVGGHRVKPQQRTEAERRARTLASLARTLSEVRRLRAAEELQRGAHGSRDGCGAGSGPGMATGPSAARDLDAFRQILSRRLEGMVARTATLSAATDERKGDV